MTDDGFTLPPGVACVTTHGCVTSETFRAYGNMRAFMTQQGVTNVSWPIVHGVLVDKARNEAALQFMKQTEKHMRANPQGPSAWLAFIDADMAFEPNALLRLLQTAYQTVPWADIVGAWCPLRGWPYLPTIDPGSGTWEPIEPNIGPIEVMRTGSAFIIIKRHVFEKMRAPWYAVRASTRPLDVLEEFETFALTRFDGKNPFRAYPEWAQIERCAAEDATAQRDPLYPWNTIGEDSGFSDRARALGFRVVVDTNVTISHVDRQLITPQRHLEAMKEQRQSEAAAAGVLESW